MIVPMFALGPDFFRNTLTYNQYLRRNTVHLIWFRKGPGSLSGKMSYRRISPSLEDAKLDVRVIISLWLQFDWRLDSAAGEVPVRAIGEA